MKAAPTLQTDDTIMKLGAATHLPMNAAGLFGDDYTGPKINKRTFVAKLQSLPAIQLQMSTHVHLFPKVAFCLASRARKAQEVLTGNWATVEQLVKSQIDHINEPSLSMIRLQFTHSGNQAPGHKNPEAFANHLRGLMGSRTLLFTVRSSAPVW